jgi:MFS family permease
MTVSIARIRGATRRASQKPGAHETSRTSERTYVLAASFSHALVHAVELTYAALLLSIGVEFGSDLLLLGVFANIGGFAFGLGALPAGFLVDRYGSIIILRITLITTAVASVIVAVSPNAVMFGVALALLGVSAGLYHPAGFAMLARTVRRARNVGLHGMIGNLGIAGAPAVAAALAVAFDWRAAYFLLAALAALGFIAALRLDGRGPTPAPVTSPRPEPVTPPTQGTNQAPSAVATAPTAPTRDAPAPAGSMDHLPFRYRWLPLILIYTAFIVNGFIYRGSITFMPTLIEEEITFSPFGWSGTAVAGALTTLALLGGAVGWYAGGFLADRYPERRMLIIWLLTMLAIPSLLVISVTSNVALLLALTFFIVTNFAMAPSFVTLVADFTAPGRLGVSFGVIFFLSFGMGSFAATFSGAVADAWGTGAVFAILSIVAVLSLVNATALMILGRSIVKVLHPEPT